jgi:AhpD family alkylhydroperoxidase
MTSQPRLPLRKIAAESYAAMHAFATAVGEGAKKSGLEDEIVHLLNIRISQVNRCAFCIDMHTIDARAAGVSEQRIYLLDGWKHAADVYSERECAALEFAEAVTRLEESGVDDAVYDRAREVFGEDQVGHLIMICTAMNAWNRLAVSARMVPGNYRRRSA